MGKTRPTTTTGGPTLLPRLLDILQSARDDLAQAAKSPAAGCYLLVPSGKHTKSYIENGHRNSGFTHETC